MRRVVAVVLAEVVVGCLACAVALRVVPLTWWPSCGMQLICPVMWLAQIATSTAAGAVVAAAVALVLHRVNWEWVGAIVSFDPNTNLHDQPDLGA